MSHSAFESGHPQKDSWEYVRLVHRVPDSWSSDSLQTGSSHDETFYSLSPVSLDLLTDI